MSFTLYNAPQSTCSQRVRFVLNAKALPFEEKKLDLLAGDQLKPDYFALNPNGVVPTLDHDGTIVIDFAVIIEYLDEVVPEPESFTPSIPSSARNAGADALHRRDAGRGGAGADLQSRIPAALCRDERGGIPAFAESKPLRKEFMLAMGRKGFPQKEMDAAMRAAAPHV